MPDLKKFFHGFDIFEGLKIDGYKLKNPRDKTHLHPFLDFEI